MNLEAAGNQIWFPETKRPYLKLKKIHFVILHVFKKKINPPHVPYIKKSSRKPKIDTSTFRVLTSSHFLNSNCQKKIFLNRKIFVKIIFGPLAPQARSTALVGPADPIFDPILRRRAHSVKNRFCWFLLVSGNQIWFPGVI